MSTTYTAKCRRCNGTGVWSSATGGLCFRCNGRGVVTITRYTADEKAAMRSLLLRMGQVRTSQALAQIKARTQELSGTRNSDLEHESRCGLLALRENDPERYVKMLDSLDAGRLDEVIHSLVEYHRA